MRARAVITVPTEGVFNVHPFHRTAGPLFAELRDALPDNEETHARRMRGPERRRAGGVVQCDANGAIDRIDVHRP